VESTRQRRRFTNSIITLLTDFGTKDGYAGTMKGVILNINPHVVIVDISHEIKRHDINEAGFVLASSYNFFPENSIHAAVVDPGVGSSRKIIAVRCNKYIFIAPDNGLLKYVYFKEKNFEVYEVTNESFFLSKISNTFHGRDIFAPVAAHLSKGVHLTEIGKKTDNYERSHIEKPVIEKNAIFGTILYSDAFGNLVTNINDSLVNDHIRTAVPVIRAGKATIKGIKKSYDSVKQGETVAIVSSAGFLEISINKGSARNILNLQEGDKVQISCY